MKKKRNILKRNSGFVVGCVLAAGASFFTADMVMSDMSNVLSPSVDVTEKGTEKELDPETAESRAYETDAFTVTAAGDIIKGVEKETETEKQTENAETETQETDENGNVISAPETDADGNVVSSEGEETGGSGNESGYNGDESYSGDSYSDSSYDDGSYSDGSYDSGSWDHGSYGYDQPIEIYDPGNGDYTYNSGGGSGSGDSGGSSGGDSGGGSGSSSGGSSGQETWGEPSDLILPGISTHYIDESELYNFSAGQIRLIRNEIFALHGRIFESQDLRDYFSQKSWYVPTYAPDDFDANMFYYLNDYEEANLKVILNYEAALAGY